MSNRNPFHASRYSPFSRTRSDSALCQLECFSPSEKHIENEPIQMNKEVSLLKSKQLVYPERIKKYFSTPTSLISYLFLFMQLLTSCDIKKNKLADPSSQFMKVYDNQAFADTYHPISISQTSDGGFLVLAQSRIASSSFFGIYLLKTDKYGELVSQKQLDDTFVNPVASLMKNGNLYYFFCMNSITLDTKLMQVDEQGNISEIIELADVQYPLSASLDEKKQQFILLNYNRNDLTSNVQLINTTGDITQKSEFVTGYNFDVEQPIIEHLTGIGKHLPFFVGLLGDSTYYFNGFYNYTLSMVFFKFNSTEVALLNGFDTQRCISVASYISGTKFATARFAYGQNFIIPNANINFSPGSIASSKDLGGNEMLELETDANIVLKKITINGKNILLYGSNNKTNQISLYAYDENTGKLLGTKHLGYSNAYKIGDITITADNGVALACTSFLSNRFARICIFKLSKTDLEEFAN